MEKARGTWLMHVRPPGVRAITFHVLTLLGCFYLFSKCLSSVSCAPAGHRPRCWGPSGVSVSASVLEMGMMTDSNSEGWSQV